LNTGKIITYRSDKSASEMLESIAYIVRKSIDDKICLSPFLSLLVDESTDIGVKKKMVVRIISVGAEGKAGERKVGRAGTELPVVW
ncbi:hypothetical protein DPMN_101395, partial [Dreissena polymorpha]